MKMSYHANHSIIGITKIINIAERSTAYVKKKNIFVKPFKCFILNGVVTFAVAVSWTMCKGQGSGH